MIKHLRDLKITYYILLLLFILTFIISALLAYYTPYSGRGFVEYRLHPIYSKMGGEIEEIYIEDGQEVEEGTPLFKLDNTKLQLDIEELRYKYRDEENRLSALDYRILEARKEVLKTREKLEKARVNFLRYRELYIDDLVAKAEYEEYELAYDTAKRELEIAELSVDSLRKERGKTSTENEVLKSLEARIKKTEKDLRDTVVRAPAMGEISIHQLYRGQIVNGSKSYGYVYNRKDMNIYVDYMEKSLINLRNGQKTLVVFDSIPGKIFKGHVIKTTNHLKSGYTSPESLQEIKEDTRWIRTTGRGRVRIVVDDLLPAEANISSGSKVAVGVVDDKHWILSGINHLWMKLVSASNYIY
ncbi:MFP transporter [Propionigenium maris DSM 9537]|uniref:MFP transporter n=1 Tax=Propionigenium maris DSM 9537 TaxID=1123000 RepID=A0A9W6LM07_9FUSO|nr:efflux RND transporter periplasmic adaptor subunit [Propionigenium maris]GLI54933.1 MFP transporter [Propionigenium maris DSM 9537]